MIEKELIIDFIENGYENEHLDFKRDMYSFKNKIEFIRDIMAMANSDYLGDKYIIIGVKDNVTGTRDIVGIEEHELIDSANWQQLIVNNIEPNIKLEVFPFKYKDKLLCINKISDTDDKPYMLKKDIDKSNNKGLCMIRKGSMKEPATRYDMDRFYEGKGEFEIRILENILLATHFKESLAQIKVSIRNLTQAPVTITYGFLAIKNSNGEELGSCRIYGLDRYVGADFQLEMQPKSEKVGYIYIGFHPRNCIKLGLDDDGYTEEKFEFEVVLIDSLENEYSGKQKECSIYVNDDVLKYMKKIKRYGIR